MGARVINKPLSRNLLSLKGSILESQAKISDHCLYKLQKAGGREGPIKDR